MSVAWDTVKAALADFIAACGVVPAEHVFWQHEAQPLTYEDVVELRFSQESAVGHDDLEQVEIPSGNYGARITGWREFVVSIRFNSRHQTTPARDALERIRASLHHPTRAAILEDAGVAFLGTETLQSFDAPSDDRMESVGVLDVRLGVVSELFDADDETGLAMLAEVGVNGETITAPES